MLGDPSDYSVLAHSRGPCGAQCVAFAGDDLVLTGWEDGAMRLFDTYKCNAMGQIPQVLIMFVCVCVCVCV